LSRQPILPGETQTASATGGGRMAGGDRRLQILSVAVSLFSQHGFRGTTTKEIAQAAGVSEAMVFRHFATKQELYAAILDHKACADHSFKNPLEIVAEALSRKDDRAVFETLAFEALEHHEHDMQFQRLLLHSALEEHELAQMFWERTVLQVYKILGTYIRERQRDGVFRDVEPNVIVRAFIGMIIHHSLNNNLWDKKRTLLTISNRQAAKEFTEILLSGIVSKIVSKDMRSGQSRSKKAAPASTTTTTTARAAAKKKKR
jgi:AcrR family transcriptional regulator